MRVDEWVEGLRPSKMAQGVYLWKMVKRSADVLTNVVLRPHPKGAQTDEIQRARRRYEDEGFAVVRNMRGASKIELLTRTDGDSIVMDVDVAPATAAYNRTRKLVRKGYKKTGIDLADFGGALGMQVWVRLEEQPRDTDAERVVQELSAQPWWDDNVRKAVDMLQLGRESVEKLYDMFRDIDHLGAGKITMPEFLQYVGMKVTPFNQFMGNFLDVVEGYHKEMTFGGFMRIITFAGLMDRFQVVQYTFKFADPEGVKALTEAQLGQLCQDVASSADGLSAKNAILRGIPLLPKTKHGMITLATFGDFTARTPVLVYPVLLLQEKVQRLVFGQSWWQKKQELYQRERRRLRRERNIAELAGGEETDPAVLRLMLVEKIVSTNQYISQCLAVERPFFGTVAVAVVHPVNAMSFNTRERLNLPNAKAVSRHTKFRMTVLTEVKKLCVDQGFEPDQVPQAILLVTGKWTIENSFMELNAKEEEVLNRPKLLKHYGREIDVLYTVLQAKLTTKEQLRLRYLRWRGKV
jgi:Ca2+-binding EF-hand superfamily protein